MTIEEFESRANEIIDQIASIKDKDERMKAMCDLTDEEINVLRVMSVRIKTRKKLLSYNEA